MNRSKVVVASFFIQPQLFVRQVVAIKTAAKKSADRPTNNSVQSISPFYWFITAQLGSRPSELLPISHLIGSWPLLLLWR
jgi:hypothetical protein